jgi:fibronectin type 3 domain-containing protein
VGIEDYLETDMRIRPVTVVVSAVVFSLFAGAAHAAPPETLPARPQVFAAVKHDLSPELRSIKPRQDTRSPRLGPDNPPIPPNVNGRLPKSGPGALPRATDPVLQRAPAPGPAMPTPTLNFAGVGFGDYGYSVGVAPPDTIGDVSPTHYVQWVNVHFAVFNRAGVMLYGPAAGNTIWTGFGGKCETTNDGDPLVRWDAAAGRWMMSQFTADAAPYYQCMAVSQTSDPTGAWYRYAFQWPNNLFNDYGKIGVWPDGYYLGVNQFNGNNWGGAGVAVFERSQMLSGQTARMIYFNLGTNYGGVFPSDLDGETAPPNGSPNVFLTFGANSLLTWKFYTNWVNTTASTVVGPTTLPVAPFSQGCAGAARGACIPQPTGSSLESLADRLMYRNAYRNFQSHESWLVTHTIESGGTPGTGPTGIRWYELRDLNGAPSVYQQGTYFPDSAAAGIYRFMPSGAMNRYGDIAIGYSVSSNTSSIPPSIRYTGRRPTLTPSTLDAETTMKAGVGSQLIYMGQQLQRWGDYSSMNPDPLGDCAFWYTNQYLKADGVFNWSTQIAAFPGGSCVSCAPSQMPTSVTAVPNGNDVTLNWSSVSGAAAYKIYKSTNGCAAPFVRIPGTVSGTTWQESTDLGAGANFGYMVTAVADAAESCESYKSTCVSVATQGDCTADPLFGGATQVAPIPSSGACGLRVEWEAATSPCPKNSNISYNVYRSTTSGFAPGASNRIAACVATFFFDDTTAAASTTYYYVVRAEDSTVGNGGACNGGNEETNVVQRKGVVGSKQSLYGPQNFDTVSGLAGWTVTGVGSGDWQGVQTCTAHSGSDIFRFGGNTCARPYTADDFTGVTVNGATGVAVPANAYHTRLTFWHRFNFEAGWDGGYLRVRRSTDAASAAIVIPASAFLENSYNGSIEVGCAAPGAGGKQAFTGDQNTFVRSTVDLDAACDALPANNGAGCSGKAIFIEFVGVSDCDIESLGWFLDDVEVSAVAPGVCTAAPTALPIMTATSRSATTRIEYVAPAGSGLSLTVREGGTDFPTGPTGGAVVSGPSSMTAGAKGSVDHGSLTNGQAYYYSAFVSNASNQFSAAKSLKATPISTTGSIKWVYTTGASALTAAGTVPVVGTNGSVFSVSNDRLVHSMQTSSAGGYWPTNWKPLVMDAPAQSRPMVANYSLSGATRVAFVSDQGGYVHAVNAATGAELWPGSPQIATMLQSSPGAYFSVYDTAVSKPGGDVILMATRESAATSGLKGLHPTDGSVLWNFDNSPGLEIGIVSASPAVSYTSFPSAPAKRRAIFTSRKNRVGSNDTLWCVQFGAGAADVTKLWSFDIGGSDSGPTISDSTVYVGNNAGQIFAFTTDGVKLWGPVSTNDGPVKGFIWVQSGTLYFTTTNNLWAYTTSGGLLWSKNFDSPSTVLVVNNKLYLGSGDGNLYQVDLAAPGGTPAAVAIAPGGTATIGNPTYDYANAMAYVGTDAGRVYGVAIPFVP